jgi:quinoprotein glucose dehydrogenase
LVDLTVDGEQIPALVQNSKQAFTYAFNRVTGEPIWPIEEREVPQSIVPTELTSPTQPYPTRPAAFEMQGLTEDDLIDFTPALRSLALEIASEWQLGPMWNPPLHSENPDGKKGSVFCPSQGGGANIPGGGAMDPETGIMYIASVKSCAAFVLVPGIDRDAAMTGQSGLTVVDWHHSPVPGGFRGPEGLPMFRPPYGRITAIDMNTGEHLWWIPNGDTPARIRNHPALQGVDLPNTGQSSHATALVTQSLLMYGEGRGGEARFHAVDKRTGEEVGTVDLPGTTDTAPMTFMHEGRQYIVTAVSGPGLPGSLVALRLP